MRTHVLPYLEKGQLLGIELKGNPKLVASACNRGGDEARHGAWHSVAVHAWPGLIGSSHRTGENTIADPHDRSLVNGGKAEVEMVEDLVRLRLAEQVLHAILDPQSAPADRRLDTPVKSQGLSAVARLRHLAFAEQHRLVARPILAIRVWVLLQQLNIEPVQPPGRLDVDRVVLDLSDRGDAGERQEEPEVVAEIVKAAGEDIAGADLLRLQLLAVGR